MQVILHKVYYKGVSCLFHRPARLPRDTNKACHDVNTSSTLAGGNVLLFTTKATQDPLAGGPVPPQLPVKSSGRGPPPSLAEFIFPGESGNTRKSKNKRTPGLRALRSGCREGKLGRSCLSRPAPRGASCAWLTVLAREVCKKHQLREGLSAM